MSLRFTVYHVDAPNRGRSNGHQIVGGFYMPLSSDEGVEVESRIVPLTSTIPFQPDGSRPIVQDHRVVHGSGIPPTDAVEIVARPGRGQADDVINAIWISCLDVQGTLHTREFPAVEGTFEFGNTRVVVEEV